MPKEPKAPTAGQSLPASTTGGQDEAEKTPTRAAPSPLANPPPSNPPPQSEGVPRRLFTTGSPATEARLNVAIKVLRDPIARNSFSRPYSGQARYWSR
jgi:hypothetical protein